MHRDLGALAAREHDLAIVGGGIFGACVAWDAALRGLSVALIERGDFAQAASANCFKMIHGGIRYLQHADLPRLRLSARERRAFLRIAPHLCATLPILIPTWGHGARGREILTAGARLYDLLTADRNAGIEHSSRRIPATRIVARREALELFPGLEPHGLTGGVVFHDGRMHSPARLALAFVLGAAERGAQVANYAEVTGFLRRGDRVCGVRVRDHQGGGECEVRARLVVNACGGWSDRLLHTALGRGLAPAPTFSRDACFAVRRSLSPECALAVPGGTRDPDAILSRAARHLFLVPWRGGTLVGVWHVVHEGDPDRARVSESELETFLAEVNAGLPGLRLRADEVVLVQSGLVLFGANRPGARDLRYGKRSLLVDHARVHGVEGLLTLVGVRYTTARAEAERAVDLACRRLGLPARRCETETTPVHGGDIPDLEAFERAALAARPAGVGEAPLRALLRNHGSAYARVLELGRDEPELLETLPGTDTLGAELARAVRSEMAHTLEDVVFRRTDLGGAGFPGAAALDAAADRMASELGWDPGRRKRELEATLRHFPRTA